MGPDNEERLAAAKQALIDDLRVAEMANGFSIIRTALNMDPEGATVAEVIAQVRDDFECARKYRQSLAQTARFKVKGWMRRVSPSSAPHYFSDTFGGSSCGLMQQKAHETWRRFGLNSGAVCLLCLSKVAKDDVVINND